MGWNCELIDLKPVEKWALSWPNNTNPNYPQLRTSSTKLSSPRRRHPTLPTMAHRHSLKLDSTQDMLRGMIFHKVEDDKHLLWGLLHVKVIGCKKLRNLDGMNVRSLLSKRKKDLSDPYVTSILGDYRLLKTKHIGDDLNPVFDEEFYCPVARHLLLMWLNKSNTYTHNFYLN